jgi:hypothetical protein
MISEQQVWDNIWPVVEQAISATLDEDPAALAQHFVPGEQAANLLDLFGFTVFEILFKLVLGRPSLGLTKAVETEDGRYLHIEYAWPDPDLGHTKFTAADAVAVRLEQLDGRWKIAEVNPAAVDLPLTSARARGILATSKLIAEADKVPSEPWILPIALYGGMLQMPLLESAMRDPVELLLLPGLQHRTYGIMSLVRGRQLWRDFAATTTQDFNKPAAWAAAAEYLISKQDMRDSSQAAVAKHYKVNLTAIVPRIKQIQQAINLQGLDERYTDLQTTQIVYNEE